MKTRTLEPKLISDIINGADHQANALIALYKMVIPNWDNIRKLNGWPACNNRTWEFICRKFIEFDKRYHPDVLAGGCWMNSGFSIDNSLPDFEILPIDPDKIIYNGTPNRVNIITIDNMRKYDGMIAIRFHRLLENNHSYYRPTRSSYKRIAKMLKSYMVNTPRPSFKAIWERKPEGIN